MGSKGIKETSNVSSLFLGGYQQTKSRSQKSGSEPSRHHSKSGSGWWSEFGKAKVPDNKVLNVPQWDIGKQQEAGRNPVQCVRQGQHNTRTYSFKKFPAYVSLPINLSQSFHPVHPPHPYFVTLGAKFHIHWIYLHIYIQALREPSFNLVTNLLVAMVIYLILSLLQHVTYSTRNKL